MNNKSEIKKILKLKKLILKNKKNYYIEDNLVSIGDFYFNFLSGQNKINIFLDLLNNKIFIYNRWHDKNYGYINYNNYIKLINK